MMATDQPIRSKQGEFKVADKDIDIVYSNYGNHLFLLLSEKKLQKIGTLLLVRRECNSPGDVATFTVETILGMSNPEVHVFGRAIGGHVLTPEIPDTSLIVSLGIRDPDPVIIPSILKQLDDLNVLS